MKLNGAVIPDEIVRRVVARRGNEHCFADLDPARTALVVIDLQHAFMNDASATPSCRPLAISYQQSITSPTPCGAVAAACSGSR